ncbi:MAG: bifunctional demethylmenaquinone methyltransferase/2-methoxy-6-polyprenyl-1,4-benzoquinol methylase UbiE [Polyangiales bacterium]
MSSDNASTHGASEPRFGSGQMFDRIAQRYDLLNRVISLGIDQRWRRRTVESLQLTAGHRVLDLATGTGDLAIMIAKTHPEVTVVGSDPSEGMLSVGRDKITASNLTSRVVLEGGDAQALPYKDQSFDAVTMAFGIRNVPDRAKALREIARVVKPGGRIAILELSEPRSGIMGPLARFHVHTVVPTLGALLSGSKEYRYLQESIAKFPSPEDFASLMRDNDHEMIAVEPMTFQTVCLFVSTPKPRAESKAAVGA